MEMIVIIILKKLKIEIMGNMYKNKKIKDMGIKDIKIENKDLIENKDIKRIVVLGRIKVSEKIQDINTTIIIIEMIKITIETIITKEVLKKVL